MKRHQPTQPQPWTYILSGLHLLTALISVSLLEQLPATLAAFCSGLFCALVVGIAWTTAKLFICHGRPFLPDTFVAALATLALYALIFSAAALIVVGSHAEIFQAAAALGLSIGGFCYSISFGPVFEYEEGRRIRLSQMRNFYR